MFDAVLHTVITLTRVQSAVKLNNYLLCQIELIHIISVTNWYDQINFRYPTFSLKKYNAHKLYGK